MICYHCAFKIIHGTFAALFKLPKNRQHAIYTIPTGVGLVKASVHVDVLSKCPVPLNCYIHNCAKAVTDPFHIRNEFIITVVW